MINKYIKYLNENNYSGNTVRSYATTLTNSSLNLKDIRAIRKFILSSKKASTCHTRYNIILGYMKWSKDKRVEALSKLNLPRNDQVYRKIISKNDLYSLTKNMNQKQALVRFLFETGVRASEVCNIISFNDKTLLVKGKGNKVREIMHNINTTNKINGINTSTKTIRLWVKEILGREFTPHSLRRSHATHMLLSGANAKSVSMQLGHAKIETTYRYLQLDSRENLKIYNKYF